MMNDVCTIVSVVILLAFATLLTECADEPSPPPSGIEIEPDTGTVQAIDVDLGPQVVWADYCVNDEDVMRGCLCILPPDGADKVTVDPKLSWE